MKLLKKQRITRARDLHCFMMIYDGLYHYCIIIIVLLLFIIIYYDYALHRLLRFGDSCQPEESLVLLCTRGLALLFARSGGALPFRGDNVDKVRGQIAEFKQTRPRC